MYCILIVVRYPKWFGWAGFLSMALFRFPLLFNKKISFWKLMGSGKSGTFDKHPDWLQWAILMSIKKKEVDHLFVTKENFNSQNSYSVINFLSQFISRYLKLFCCKTCTLILEPIEGFGEWDGKECFGNLTKKSNYKGQVCVLTRATIRLNKLNSFWKNVPAVAAETLTAKGLEATIGIGEVPFIKQATFSIWESKDAMKQFAYKQEQHAAIIKKTRAENWYKEEMFVRFKLIRAFDSLKKGKYF